MQSPTGVNGIVFNSNGRQIDDTARANTNSNAKSSATRRLVNITIADSIYRDRTRIVVNDDASLDYELGRDAEKIMAGTTNPMQIYTLHDDVMYAINELPLDDNEVRMGYNAVAEGTYTIAATIDEGMTATLVDLDLNTEVTLNDATYTFYAERGTNETRFSIKITKKDDPVGIDTHDLSQQQRVLVNGNTLTVDADYQVFNILGQPFGGYTANTTITLPMGVYFVVSNNVSHKIVITK